MRFIRFITAILHPIVIPTVVTLVYFLTIPIQFNQEYQLMIISLVFVTTYVIPTLFIFLFRRLGILTSYDKISLRDRKLPVLVMLVLFYLIGKTLFSIPNFRDLGGLFYSSSMALALLYFIYLLHIKASLHLMALGVAVGFFLHLNSHYSISFLEVIILGIILSGFVGSALLYLKYHKEKEIYIGFFIGLLSPVVISNFL